MIRLKEVFGPTLQGEGDTAGTPAIFVRTSGCNMWNGKEADKPSSRCAFCDTDFVGGMWSTAREIAETVFRLASGKVQLVVITGGEPTLQPSVEMAELVSILQDHGMIVQVETNGTLNALWLAACELVTVSPKLPLAQCQVDWRSVTALKILYPHPDKNITPESFDALGLPVFIQPVWGSDYSEAVNKVLEMSPRARLSLQTHKITGVQ